MVMGRGRRRSRRSGECGGRGVERLPRAFCSALSVRPFTLSRPSSTSHCVTTSWAFLPTARRVRKDDYSDIVLSPSTTVLHWIGAVAYLHALVPALRLTNGRSTGKPQGLPCSTHLEHVPIPQMCMYIRTPIHSLVRVLGRSKVRQGKVKVCKVKQGQVR
ncbi:hypothetical protein BZA05DRAFT_208869 [Tricharina praecox]|uniref:uncharacterized protein n=1 Tax=Tricharina praecox TaxID=43433 RepID=UPI0022208C47|nr:uncharacterized protein BZA05DRAFT_208869 [Tricharina praecox]KAI5842043.1 hypothetical protein BZA05DRAFT_208869 [Tricharina praecox]